MKKAAFTVLSFCLLMLLVGTHLPKAAHRICNRPNPILKCLEESGREYSTSAPAEIVPCKTDFPDALERISYTFESAFSKYNLDLSAFIEARPPPALS